MKHTTILLKKPCKSIKLLIFFDYFMLNSMFYTIIEP